MKTICLINQKGGCGKTTTALNIAAGLALKNKKVLLIDLDPQAHATVGLGIDPDTVAHTLLDCEGLVKRKDNFKLKDLIERRFNKFDFIASNIFMAAFEQILNKKIRGKEYWLFDLLSPLKKEYDYVIIDCPPNLGLLTINALVAGNICLIPVDTSIFSINGAKITIETIKALKRRLTHEIEVKILLTMFDKKTNLAKDIYKKCCWVFKDMCLNTKIPLSIKAKEAAVKGKPLVLYRKGNFLSQSYLSLTNELISVIEKHSDVGPHFLFDKVRFSVLAPKAKKVFIAGDFNNWNPNKTKLIKKDGGIWVKEIEMPVGEYEYKLIVDGKWMQDPHNKHKASDAYGGFNSVLRYQ